jgi:uncharacterized protein
MKSLWLEKKSKYDGTQLRSLFGYLEHKVLGDSLIGWVGACDVSFEHMVDGEDLLEKSEIRGSEMLHFIFEIFEQKLITGVFLQRLFASIAKDLLEQKANISLKRQGDDLYWEGRKLSISIASRSPNSVMVHFAINVKNAGTPVPTCALEDWKLSASEVGKELMKRFEEEYHSILEATWKVKSVL